MTRISFPPPAPTKTVPEAIHCRFSIATMEKLQHISEATGQSLSRTISGLLDIILPFVEFQEVVVTSQQVTVNLPDQHSEVSA